MNHQDWTPVILTKSRAQLKKEGKIEKNKHLGDEALRLIKIENELAKTFNTL